VSVTSATDVVLDVSADVVCARPARRQVSAAANDVDDDGGIA
jgi:hypothetical protein